MARRKTRSTREGESTGVDEFDTHPIRSAARFLHALETNGGDSSKAREEVGLDEARLRRMLKEDAQFAHNCFGISRSFDINGQQRFLIELRNTRDIFAACRVSGIPRELAYRRRHDSLWFQGEWSKIEEAWERKLAERGEHPESYLDKDIIEGGFAIVNRIRDSDKIQRATRAFTSLYGTQSEWILRAHLLPKYGIPPTSVEEDYLEWKPMHGKRGGHAGKGGVEYLRTYLITFVVYRWEPKDPPKDRRT